MPVPFDKFYYTRRNRGFKFYQKERNLWKKRNVNKERNIGNDLVGRRLKYYEQPFQRFVHDEYGIKFDKRNKKLHAAVGDLNYNSTATLISDTMKGETDSYPERTVGNIKMKTFYEAYPEIARNFVKRNPIDEKWHHDQTRWDKNKTKTNQRKKERDLKDNF